MGNSNSSKSSSKIKQKSESMEIRKKPEKTTDFTKSRSMMDMGSKSRGSSTTTASGASSSLRQKSITSINNKDRPKSTRDLKSSGISRQKSMKKDAAHPISPKGRDIIMQCFENPHSEFANKKRGDYQRFILNLGKERSYVVNLRLKSLVEDIVSRIHDADYIEMLSKQYGEEHVELKQYGFKPDFWVAVADAMTLEGVILDMANHQPADTVSAWSSLVTMIFSAVRDGYYSELRRHRMSSRRTLRQQNTVDSSNDNEVESQAASNLASHLESLNVGGSEDDYNVPSTSTASFAYRNGPSTSRSHSCYSTDSATSTSTSRRNGGLDTPSTSYSASTPVRRPIFE
ncbi:unnamed protein product [Caenorhabditis bovis]|uniref:Globin family profile domain-containing protein n=1 Tax=Caenorhabditis bovis TaxID=2654633 RepID=A0A8S1ECE3_9PELO|nr:unnamed protein product [Caenorhabditis bovis]